MTLPDESLTLAWCAGGDIMLFNEDGPERVSTERAAELLTFYEGRAARVLTGTGREYVMRWAHDLGRAIKAQHEWTLCAGPLRRAA